ncbi:hypothetical protein [uncultured Lacinutrix sp.]|uniref:hypothetical protein n=1 Tax=uncultured Lacinutrix sp. TaxID=574032 RepID=UPI002606B083|nr:hypothetical protein [uncultured Lacinutrix sp.]
MKKVFLKLAGSLAVVAIIAISSVNTTNAQAVSMDNLNVNTAENLDQVLLAEHPWTFISSEYVYKGTK